MKSRGHLTRSFLAAFCGGFLLCSLIAACGETSGASGTAGSGPVGAAATGGQSTVGGTGGTVAPGGSGGTWTAPVAGEGVAGSGGSPPAAGQGGAGSGAGGTTEDCVPYEVNVPPPDCAGLSGYDLTVCYQIAHGELPATCQGLCGADKDACCAKVGEAHLEIANYPECEQGLLCPAFVLDQLKNNPYGNSITEECGTCICENCNEQINYVNTHGQGAVTMVQCGLGKLVTRDCFVCNPPPCDTQLATNLMTGPCSQEVMGACPNCQCTGAFDVNCLSLAACLDAKIAFSRPCTAAHATMECIMANCPACPPLTPCPSALMQ